MTPSHNENNSSLPNTGTPDYTRLPRLPIQQGDVARARLYLKLIRLLLRGIFLLVFRIRVAGLRNVPRGPVIICANHLGWADPFLVLLFFPVEPRIYVLADHNAVSRTGFRATMMRLLRVVVTLDPDNAPQALRIMDGVLQRGGSILIFPEAAPPAYPQEGVIRDLHHGASLLSVLANLPVLPVGIGGTSELWLRRTLRVRVGKPISPAEFEGDRRVRARALTARLERALGILIPGGEERARVKLLRGWLTRLFA